MSTHNTYLAHHGVIGQKWGVRRYQNYDGTYTQKGMEHYRASKANYEEAKALKKMAKQGYKKGYITEIRIRLNYQS